MGEKCKLCYFRMEKDENSSEFIENLYEKDFIFYNKYIIKYMDKMLYIEKNNKYLSNFYSFDNNTNVDITGIIGKNGTGKTALLSYIIRFIYSNVNYKYNYIIIFEIDDKINIFYNNIEIRNVNELKGNGYEINEQKELQEFYNIYKKLDSIFYSNSVNLRNNLIKFDISSIGYYNISLYSDLQRNFKKNAISIGNIGTNTEFLDMRFQNDNLVEVKNNLARKNLKYIIEENYFNVKFVKIDFPFFSKDNIFVKKSITDTWRYKDEYNKDIEYKVINGYQNVVKVKPTENEYLIYKKLIEKYNKAQEDYSKAKYMILFAIIDIYFETLYGMINQEISITYIRDKIAKICIRKNVNIERVMENIFKQLEEITIDELIKKSHLQNNFVDELIEKIRLLNIKYKTVLEIVNKLYSLDKKSFKLGKRFSKDNDFDSNKPYILVCNKNFKYLDNILLINNFNENIFDLEFRGLSNGEQAFLDLFSNFYDIKDKIRNESILIFMDEPDLYLHPEWQRKLIYDIIKFFEKFYANKYVQVIISSNSPYILSDLYADNVIMLGSINEVAQNIFASNIHDLLRNKFFMDFTIGEFSKQKIEKILKHINSTNVIDKTTYEQLKQYIDIIGDELLKCKINSMLEEKRYDKN